MKSTAEILREARALIDTPEKWATGFYAFGPNGETSGSFVSTACQFCARGAIYRVGGDYVDTTKAEDTLTRALPEHVLKSRHVAVERHNAITFFNDDIASHADVLAAFDRAIALAETQA